MAYGTGIGWRVYIGPTTSASTETAYAALSWVEIGGVESVPEFGGESAVVTFTTLADGTVQKLKGSTDYGTISLTVARDPLDPGQIAAAAAAATKFAYAIKIAADDGADANDTDSVFYSHALVTSARVNPGGAGDPSRRPIGLAFTKPFIEKPSTAVA